MNKEFTIEEFHYLKSRVELLIYKELSEFEQMTGLSVSHINLEKDLSDPNKTSVSAVKLAVIL